MIVSDVLTPCLELFGRRANLFAKLSKRVPEAMRVKVWQAYAFEDCAEDAPYGIPRGPVLAGQSNRSQAVL